MLSSEVNSIDSGSHTFNWPTLPLEILSKIIYLSGKPSLGLVSKEWHQASLKIYQFFWEDFNNSLLRQDTLLIGLDAVVREKFPFRPDEQGDNNEVYRERVKYVYTNIIIPIPHVEKAIDINFDGFSSIFVFRIDLRKKCDDLPGLFAQTHSNLYSNYASPSPYASPPPPPKLDWLKYYKEEKHPNEFLFALFAPLRGSAFP